MADQGFECGSDEVLYIEGISRAANLELEDGNEFGKNVPTKKGWIDLFTNLNEDILGRASQVITDLTGWDLEDESRYGLIQYLKSIKPVIKDLRDSEDAIFIRRYGGDIIVEPEKAEKLLAERALKHVKQFNNMISPVI